MHRVWYLLHRADERGMYRLQVFGAQPGNTMLLAGNVASVTLRISLCCHLLHLLAGVEAIATKMAVASGESSVGRRVATTHYASLCVLRLSNRAFTEPRIILPPWSPVLQRFVLRFLEMRPTNVTSFIYQEKVSQQCTFHFYESLTEMQWTLWSLTYIEDIFISVSIRDICIQPHNCVYNLHFKAT
jgi:hypothetical protein